ncbi:MAG TPA: hypothetical protein PKC79_03540 [Solidesulfovibrio magneticus]|nr:hypothetical protein [Solidesulfovibrio magneticus]
MKQESEWDDEIYTLSVEWQPAISTKVQRYYTGLKRRMPAKAAFVETYEKFFLNPTKEDVYG